MLTLSSASGIYSGSSESMEEGYAWQRRSLLPGDMIHDTTHGRMLGTQMRAGTRPGRCCAPPCHLQEYMASDLYKKTAGDVAVGGCPADFNPGPSDTTCTEKPLSGDELAKNTFHRMDRNHDGQVSEAEYKAYNHADDHTATDLNGDGKLSRDEFMRAPMHFRGGLDKTLAEKKLEFKKADTNHDGKLSRKESEEALLQRRREALYPSMMTADDDVEEEMWTSVTNPIIAGHDTVNQPEIYPTSAEASALLETQLEHAESLVSNDLPVTAGDAEPAVEGISEKEEKEELKSL